MTACPHCAGLCGCPEFNYCDAADDAYHGHARGIDVAPNDDGVLDG